MKTIKINLYKFSELSYTAKQKAMSHFKDKSFIQAAEYMNTLHKGLAIFGSEMQDYRVDWVNGHVWHIIKHSVPKSIQELRDEELRDYLLENYSKYIEFPFLISGFHADEYFMRPVINFIEGNMRCDFDSLINECIFDVISQGIEDYTAQNSDEYIVNYLRTNNHEFTESGNLYKISI